MSRESTGSYDGLSGIPESMFKRESESVFFAPDILIANYDQNFRCFVATDQAGFIPTKDEFLAIVETLGRIYELADDEDVKAHNRSKYDQMYNESSPVTAKRQKPQPKAEPGYVYLLSGNGVYKIGRAKQPKVRSQLLATQLPFPVELVCVLYADDYKATERDLHGRFAPKRLNGEWFNLDESDVAYIKGLER